MKNYVLVLWILVLWKTAFSQTSGQPYGMHDNNGTYYFASLNLSTGTITDIAAVSGCQNFVSGSKYFINSDANTYTFSGHDGTDARLYTIKISDGSVLSSPVFNGLVVGLRYNCKDGKVYALEEVSPTTMNLVSVDVTTGNTSFIGAIAGVSGYVSESFSLDSKRGYYHFKGLNAASFYQYSIDLNTGFTVANPSFPDNVAAPQYSCMDSTVYGLWEDGTDYKLEAIHPTNGTHSTVGVLAGIAPGYITASSCITADGQFTYRGFTGAVFSLITIDVSTATILNNVPFSDIAHGWTEIACCSTTTAIHAVTENQFQLYPNPSTAATTLSWEQPIVDGTILIYDVYGRMVRAETNISGNQFVLERSALPTGIYSLQLTEKNKNLFTSKFILN